MGSKRNEGLPWRIFDAMQSGQTLSELAALHGKPEHTIKCYYTKAWNEILRERKCRDHAAFWVGVKQRFGWTYANNGLGGPDLAYVAAMVSDAS